ncbi:mitochondrial carrier domain-containing protein [Pavlovales sp. CCMP2436]|nr:mitochondrial carrier domain-containing protein [Pavlovales sp. CCMP2436]
MLDDVVAGFAAGFIGTLLGYPLDTVRVHQQAGAATAGARESLASSARQLYAARGLAGFYAGVTVPLLGVTVINTLSFTSYAQFRLLLGVPPRPAQSSASPPFQQFDARCAVAGALIGPLAAIITTPMDLVKIQMQQANQPRTLAAVRALFATGGLAGLYVGGPVNVLREVVFGAGYFGAYEFTREKIGALPPAASIPIAGAVGGVVGWLVMLPLDTIKTVQQSGSVRPGEVPRAVDIAARIWAAHGARGFWRGASAAFLRAIFVSATRFSAYEWFTLGTLRARREAANRPRTLESRLSGRP